MKEYAFNRNWEPLENLFTQLNTSSWADFAKTFPQNPDLWVWDWIKLNIDFNPIDYWSKVKQNTFIAYGSKDQEDNMPVFESIYRLQKAFYNHNKNNYEIRIYETGHAMYEDDVANIRKEFIDDLLNWLKMQ